MQESGIFKSAVKLPPGERSAFLDKACGVNAALRLEVEALLRAHDQPGDFLHRPPIADAATFLGPGPERPGMRVGPYKLLQFLGEGGMGTVFLAEQSKPVRRMVALKIIKPGMDSSQILARFEAERQALAMMDHPNIARVLDAGSVGNLAEAASPGATTEPRSDQTASYPNGPPSSLAARPYFVMELVKGVPIVEFCDKNKLTTRQRLELFIPVCLAIQHAHMKGIIHRDIKPSNVLIALYDGKPVPKVIDFGVAKAMSDPLTDRTLFTQIGQIVGTFEYMSPEQATLNQLDIDTRSDIYSLGVLLYELLTGLTPINRERLKTLAFDQLLRTIREEEPQRPSDRLTSEAGALATAATYRGTESSKLAGLLRGELDWIVMKCLEKERDRRFVTAGSLAKDIERYLNDEPVTACPPSLGYRMRKTYRKNKALITTAGIVATVLILGIIASTWQAIRATRAESESLKDRDVAVAAQQEMERKSQETAAVNALLQKSHEESRRNQYFWDMQVIPTAWETNRISQVRELLGRHDEDLRHFEWHYWNRQIHSELRRLDLVAGNQNTPNSANQLLARALNATGRRAAMLNVERIESQPDPNDPMSGGTSSNWYVDLYDTSDGRRLMHKLLYTSGPGMATRASTLQISPDGNRVAVLFYDPFPMNANPTTGRGGSPSREKAHIRVYDLATDEPILDQTAEDLGWASASAFFFPDGKRLGLLKSRTRFAEGTELSASMIIWGLESQPAKQLCEIEGAYDTLFVSRNRGQFGLSPDGSRFALVKVNPPGEGDDRATPRGSKVIIIDTNTGKPIHSWPSPLTGLSTATFSPDGTKLALVSSRVSTARGAAPASFEDPFGISNYLLRLSMIDAGTGKELYQQKVEIGENVGFSASPSVVSFSPDGECIYLSNMASTLNGIGAKTYGFDIETGEPLPGFDSDFALGQHRFSSDSTRLMIVESNAIVVRDTVTGRVQRTLRGHVVPILSLALSADGQRIVSLDRSGEIKEWDASSPSAVLLRGMAAPRGRNPGGFNPTRPLGGNASISPDGRFVAGVQTQERPKDVAAARAMESKYAIWDSTNGQMRPLTLRPIPVNSSQRSITNQVAFSPDSRLVSLLRLCLPRTPFTLPGEDPPEPAADREPPYFDLTVWETATGNEIAHRKLTQRASMAVITSDGKSALLSTLSPYGLMKIDLATGEPRWKKEFPKDSIGFSGGPGGSRNQNLLLSPDGRRLLSIANVRSQRSPNSFVMKTECQVLDMETGEVIRTIERSGSGGPTTTINAAWSADGACIALGADRRFANPDKTPTLQVIHVETGKVLMSADFGSDSGLTRVQPAFSPDGRRIAARVQFGSTPNTLFGGVKLWDVASGREVLSLPYERESLIGALDPPVIAFSADGRRLIEFSSGRSRAAVLKAGGGSDEDFGPAIQVIDATPVSAPAERRPKQ